ncbi:FKBP-type peptidyl-prolyl cis-trans isomerase [Candidatus Protochlamydia naegleriophila]|uniref:Peptidyl-prolyl cis-trans isomerase n=1 Tax=Candidatus Protochlamydia naegleriophila TaxID=389348 RepID=A0A0U5K626_9BACT|nr:FKBP-type peptidyl-prolyl cis-trans isomerase [Candidatus Protochlamydia naegleriophila]CUI17595.1 FKBP-type peptidyl-prolyl cis-trans isomerase [Candidatus Protochlamydia naegleriophila]
MLKKTRLLALTSLGVLLGWGTLQADDTNSVTNQADKRVQATADKSEKSDQIDMKKLSEAFGHFIGRNLQSPGLKFDLDAMIKGIRDGASGQPAPLSEKEYEDMMAAVQERAFKEMSSNNLKTANDFMTKNSQATGIVEIVPGKLQYSTIKEGTGPAVEAHSSPKIHYTGKYQDGTVFGTSEEMGGPITIPLDQTIPGFSKGIVGMKEGEKRRLYVHPDLGYGTTGQLPPNELLIFDIEVIKANSDDAKGKGKADANQEDDADDEDLFLDEEEFDLEPTPSDKKAAPATRS